jgi:hypothetical protein
MARWVNVKVEKQLIWPAPRAYGGIVAQRNPRILDKTVPSSVLAAPCGMFVEGVTLMEVTRPIPLSHRLIRRTRSRRPACLCSLPSLISQMPSQPEFPAKFAFLAQLESSAYPILSSHTAVRRLRRPDPTPIRHGSTCDVVESNLLEILWLASGGETRVPSVAAICFISRRLEHSGLLAGSFSQHRGLRRGGP